MAKPFKDLLSAMPPERQARITDHAENLMTELALRDLGQARHLTQQQLAADLSSHPAAPSEKD